MSKKQNQQHQPAVTSTPEIEQAVSLQRAAAVCGVKEVTIRSWCRKRHVKWKHVKIGAKTRCIVRISDVRAYIAKRNPSDVGKVESSPAMLSQAETTTAPQVSAAVLKEPVGGAATESPPAAPAQVPACAGQVHSNQNTTETNSTTQATDANAAVSKPTTPAQLEAVQSQATPKQTTNPKRQKASGLLVHRAKNSMRKCTANELMKITAWIHGRLAKKFAATVNSTSAIPQA